MLSIFKKIFYKKLKKKKKTVSLFCQSPFHGHREI